MPDTNKPLQTIKMFCSYAHEDEELKNELMKHLKPLEQDGLVTWFDGEIIAGQEWEKEIHAHLNTAKIILLLISKDFINSDYCTSIELKQAMERHERGEARVIPIIVGHALWERLIFSKLQVLPSGGKPVSSWSDHDEAFKNIALGILRVIEIFNQNPFTAHRYLIAPMW